MAKDRRLVVSQSLGSLLWFLIEHGEFYLFYMLWFILRFHLGRKKVLQELKTCPNEIKNTTAKTTESGPGWDVVWDTCNQKKPKHYYWLSPVGCKGLLKTHIPSERWGHRDRAGVFQMSHPTRILALSSWGHSASHVNTGGVHAPANLVFSHSVSLWVHCTKSEITTWIRRHLGGRAKR